MFKKILVSIVSVVLVITLIALVGLYALPGVAIHYANDWYGEQGEGYQLEVKNWEFSPFATHLVLNKLKLTHPDVGQGKTQLNKLVVDINLWALLQQKVLVNSLQIDGLDLALEAALQDNQESLRIAGLSIPLNAEETSSATTDEDSKPWALELKTLEIHNHQYLLQAETEGLAIEAQTRIKKLQLNGLNTTDNSQPKVNIEIELQKLLLTGAQKIQLNAPVTLKAKGRLKQLLSLPQWQGQLSVDDFSVSLNEELSVAFSQLALENMVADAQQQRLETLSLQQFVVTQHTDAHQQALALAVDSIRAEAFRLDALKPQLERLLIKDVSIKGQEQPLLQLQHYGLNDLAADLSEENVSVSLGQQHYSGLDVHIERDSQGRLVGLSNEPFDAKTAQAEALVQTDSSAPTDSSVDKPLLMALVFAGFVQQADAVDVENPADNHIHIIDRSVAPALKTKLSIEQVNIGTVTGRLEASSLALSESVPVATQFTVGKYGKVDVNGQLTLFEREGVLYPQGELTLKVRQLDLVPLNGYFIEALGYQLDRGSLDVDANIRFDQAQLGGNVSLLLRNSKFTPKDEETIKKVSKQISMPLDMAVGLLRDEHGNLRLNIPLSGDLSDPDFGLADITKQLTQKALKAGTVYFLKQALQPYGAVLSVAGLAGDYLFAIRLDAITYAQGISDLTSSQRDNLTKVAELMLKKKDIEVRACPFVSAEEAAELGENWAELANERGQKVKDWLIEYQEALGARTSICRPQKGKQAQVVLGVD